MCRLLAIAGALLTILTLAVNPFVQQVIKYESRLTNATQASLPIAVKYDTTGNFGQPSLDIDLPMKAAIMDGLLNLDAPANQFGVKSDCSTGNCTWPAYQTLAVCSACSDLTPRLTTKLVEDPSNDNALSYNATLPNGLSLVTPWYESSAGLFSMTMNNTIDTDNAVLRSIAFPENKDIFPLIDFFTIIGPYNASAANLTQIGPYAAECVLRFCVQSYFAYESDGIFQEISSGEARFLNWTSEIYRNQSQPQDYQAYYDAANGLNIHLGKTFVGAFQGQNSLSGTLSFPSDVTQAIFQSLNSTPHTLDSVMSNVAKSMTLDMRTRADAGDPVIGNAAAEQSFVHIEWAWLSLPLALLVLVLAFLLLVFVTTRRLGLEPWKDSSLATLFHGLDNEGRRRVRTLNFEEDMGEAAQGLIVRMEMEDHGWALRSVR